MKNNEQLKRESKEILRLNNKLYIYGLILIIISMFSSNENYGFFMGIIGTLCSIQYIKFCLETLQLKENPDFFDFSKLKKSIKVILLQFLYCLPGIILIVIGFSIMGFSSFFIFINENSSIFIVIGFLTIIIGGILYVIQSYSYCLGTYMVFDTQFDNMTARECVSKSAEIMNGHKMEYFVLILSFFFWFMLGIFTCGLAYIYVFPYYYLTLCNYYLNLTKKDIIEQI